MTVIASLLRLHCALAFILLGWQTAFAQAIPRRTPTPSGAQTRRVAPGPVRYQPPKKATELIHPQDPININQAALAQLSPDDSRVVVSIPKQRAYLLQGNNVVIDTPISSGKRGHSTPTGKFNVMEKDANHHSSLYGDFRDSSGRIVRAGVSARIDAAPSGTHFVGAEMKWFMRLTGEGVGMHIGILPGYPASHGCIRMPSQSAELFYAHVKVGTPVEVLP